MIQSVEIENLRGIREGKLDGLSALTILVGPNGCGKSTILDGLFLAGARAEVEGKLEVLRRRPTIAHDERWLRWRGDYLAPIRVAVGDGADDMRAFVSIMGAVNVYHFEGLVHLPVKVTLSSLSATECQNLHAMRFAPGGIVKDIVLIDTRSAEAEVPPYRLYTEAMRRGQRDAVKELVSRAIPGATGVEILTMGDSPVLYVVFPDHAVPLGAAGDGFAALICLILQLAACAGGLVLVEEPECHQHPRNMMLAARALRAAAARDIQIVLTTHSLEFIDALLCEASEDDLDRMSLFRLKLQDGVLISSRLTGQDIAFARHQIEDDLR